MVFGVRMVVRMVKSIRCPLERPEYHIRMLFGVRPSKEEGSFISYFASISIMAIEPCVGLSPLVHGRHNVR